MMRICIAAVLFAALSACGALPTNAPDQRAGIPDGEMLVLERPPEIHAASAREIASARTLMERLSPEELQSRTGARPRSIGELPWISLSAAGREFLAMSEPRILVRGDPAESCAVAFAAGGQSAQPIAELAIASLERCIAESGPGCGCRVIAANSVLLVPLEEASYATGAAARLRVPSLGLEKMLVAEAAGRKREILRDVSHRVGEVVNGPGDEVTVRLEGIEGVFMGEARSVGFRRGRLARRIYATNAQGERLVLLIGFGPNELAEMAGAWLAWPSDA